MSKYDGKKLGDRYIQLRLNIYACFKKINLSLEFKYILKDFLMLLIVLDLLSTHNLLI